MKNIVEVNIKNYEDVIAKFDNDKLSSELASFIYRECMTLPLDEKIEINIKSECDLDEKKQNQLVDMIHAYFGQEIKEMLIFDKKRDYQQIFLLILGVLLIGISSWSFLNNFYIIREISLIAGWVMIWELLYNVLFYDIKRKIKQKRYKQLTKAKINFI